MKAFVTGATGLLGSNLVDMLLNQGHQVKALVRSEEKVKQVLDAKFNKTSLETIVGDICRTDGFASHLSDCDVVFHTAAYYKEYHGENGDHEKLLAKVNVGATINLIDACRQRGVNNIVYVSSNGVTKASEVDRNPARIDQTNVDKESVYDEDTDNLYFKSKIKAEKEIDSYLKRYPEMRIILIRPSLMIGPRDSGPTPAGQVILNYLNKKMPMVLPCNVVLVDARDVAKAMISAVNNGASGDRFIIGGKTYSMLEFAETLEKVSGVKAPKRRPPYPVAMTILALSLMLGKITGRVLPIKPRDLRRMHFMEAPDSTRAKRILDVKFTELGDSLKSSIDWFENHGYVDEKPVELRYEGEGRR
jgi:nucleoside-diphosphate-sugar epimerase